MAATGYRRLIEAATQCPEADAGAVERVMRVEHPCLDGLDLRAFNACARRAWRLLREMRADGISFYDEGAR